MIAMAHTRISRPAHKSQTLVVVNQTLGDAQHVRAACVSEVGIVCAGEGVCVFCVCA